MSEHIHANEQHPDLSLTDHARKNKAMWEASSDDYEETHASTLSGDRAMAWGLWRVPEAELHVLGEVAGKDVLEFGCGAARWSIALVAHGARPVGLDLSHVGSFSTRAASWPRPA